MSTKLLMPGHRRNYISNINVTKSRPVALIKEQGRRSRLAYRKCRQSGLGTGGDVRVTCGGSGGKRQLEVWIPAVRARHRTDPPGTLPQGQRAELITEDSTPVLQ